MKGVSELGFNVPPTSRSYGDGPQFKVISENQKKKKAENRACDPLIGTRALHPRSTVTGKIQEKEMGNNIKGRIGMDTANGNQREIKVNP